MQSVLSYVLESEYEWLGELQRDLKLSTHRGVNPGQSDKPEAEFEEKHCVCDPRPKLTIYNLTLSRLLSRHHQMSHGRPCASRP
jgi:hypothetical protein